MFPKHELHEIFNIFMGIRCRRAFIDGAFDGARVSDARI